MNHSGDGSLGILVTNGGAYGVRRTGNRFVWGTTRPAPSRTRRLTTTVMERRPSQPSPRLSSPSPFPPAVARAVPDSLRHREQRREKDLRKLCGEASRALWYVSSATSSALVVLALVQTMLALVFAKHLTFHTSHQTYSGCLCP